MNLYDELFPISYRSGMGVAGLSLDGFSFYLKRFFECVPKSILVVCPTMFEANKLYDALSFRMDTHLFPSDDFAFSKDIMASPELKTERIALLSSLLSEKRSVVVTDLVGYLKKLPQVSSFEKQVLKLKVGDEIDLKELSRQLMALGYEQEVLVHKTGDIAVRGFVLDLFGVMMENPLRIEFFGDEIESIRYFDVDSQKSIEEVKEVSIYPFCETDDGEGRLTDYIHDCVVVYKDYEQLKNGYERLLLDGDASCFFDFENSTSNDYFYYFDLDSDYSLTKDLVFFESKSVSCFYEKIPTIRTSFMELLDSGKTIVLCLSKPFKSFFEELDLPYVKSDFLHLKKGTINLVLEPLRTGFMISNVAFFSEYELFFRRVRVERRQKFKFSSRISDLSKIEVGDYVVHYTHGIAVYNGIKTIKKNGLDQDYLELLYDKGDKLYIPVKKIDLIGKYTGKDGFVPKINSLHSTAWAHTKARVREKIRYEAKRLLNVQAKRALEKGFAFSRDNEMQALFESEFLYPETPDQLKVTAEIKQDMESIQPMDRILCGDVGYGKTEVAFRAIFKAVMDSKQVFYLCPTTLLCKQQYEAALKRFSSFPVKMGILNRFTSPKDTEKLLLDIKEGKVDVVFGTHRLLSDDVKPLDLGLLIVDEEQRFGVAHKEKIKEYKANIDVLTLTATPIPRTLQMAMVGLRNLSLIETPPLNRHSVQTYVMAYDKRRIRDIIYKELSRDGQVFILYNYVADIEKRMMELEALVPDARFIYAHGKMSKTELEDRMNAFISHQYDVLLCTTIIETGMDIPNANSLIILDADHFGLSQLYQIRGRVGRSDRVAYAYLMYDPKKVLTELAVKRLKVIKEYTELGSGFKIAARDLSIRGAGDILGSEQAGFIDSVGIDLYMKMLDEEMRLLKGEEVIDVDALALEEEKSKEITLVSNHIDDDYAGDLSMQIYIHQLIDQINCFDDVAMVYQEIKDRFGTPDEQILMLIQEKLFEHYVKLLDIVDIKDSTTTFEFAIKNEDVSFEDLFMKSVSLGSMFSFSYKNRRLHVKVLKNKLKKHVLFYLNDLFHNVFD